MDRDEGIHPILTNILIEAVTQAVDNTFLKVILRLNLIMLKYIITFFNVHSLGELPPIRNLRGLLQLNQDM